MFKKMVAGWLRVEPQPGVMRGSRPLVGSLGRSRTAQNVVKSRVSVLMVLGSLATLPAFGAGLNDTGITLCADMTTMENICQTAANAFPGQDGFYGRDTMTSETSLKVGASGTNPITGKGNGFDFTKISSTGTDLPASATNWDCVRDNVTGLTWEVKTTSGLRNQNHTYSWYKENISYTSTNSVSNSVSSPDNPVYLGVPSKAYASAGVCETAKRCDTEKFVEDVNKTNLCGASDWRMPTVQELQGILDFGRVLPAIDTDYFPNTPSFTLYWSGTPDPWAGAWYVSFGVGFSYLAEFGTGKLVRLVRGVQ